MKFIFLYLFTILSISVNSQTIKIDNISGNKSKIRLSNNKEISITFDNYCRAETNDSFNLINYKIYADHVNNKEIGKYNKTTIQFDNGNKYRFKLDKKNKSVLVLDNNKNTVIEGKMFFDEDKTKEFYLKEIKILKNNLNSEIIESWLTLVTIERLYGSEKKELTKNFIEGAVIGLFL